MLKNYLSITFRLLNRNRTFLGVNLFGLSIGLATFLLIFNYFHFENTYDQFHDNSEDLYRVTVRYTNNDDVEEHHAGIAIPIGPHIKEATTGIINQTRMFNMQGFSRSSVISRPQNEGGLRYHEEEIYFTDPSFFEMFTYRILAGSKQPLSEPNSVVITESIAKKYFGDENPVGKELVLSRKHFFTVTAVLDDPPVNSHQKFEILFSIADGARLGMFFDQNLHLYGDIAQTYVQLKEGTEPSVISNEITSIATGLTDRKFDDVNLRLQSITDIHLFSDLTGEMQQNGSAALVYALVVFAFVILLLAWSNYINLAIVKSSKRTKEIGIRKVLGAEKKHVFILFLFEALLLNMSAFLFACGLTEMAQPFLNELVGYNLPALFSLPVPMLTIMAGLVLGGVAITGLVPALIMWTLQPSSALKGNIFKSLSGTRLRYGLVTLQLASVLILLTVSLGIYRQVNYMLDKELEMNVDQVLVVRGPDISGGLNESRVEAHRRFVSGFDQIKTTLLSYPSISGVTSSNYIPGDYVDFQASLKRQDSGDAPSRLVERIFVNYNFHSVYELNLVSGRFFQEGRGDNSDSVVLNESAASLLGFSSPDEAVGSNILYFDDEREVVGIVKDFHFNSLKHSLKPLLFIQTAEPRFVSVRLESGQLKETLAIVEKEWNTIFPLTPFEYYFADDHFNRQYQDILNARILVTGIAGLSLIIACFGLFGLAFERVTSRAKEISIRKVLGATSRRIISMLYLDMLRPMGISFVIAMPISWYLLQKWISGFHYHITLGPDLYLFTGLVGLVIVLATVSWQSIQAALANPVESLRSE